MEKTHYLNVSELLDAIMLAKPSVVGRIIIPQDNSYATSLETGCETRVYGKRFVCLSEPYVKEIVEPLCKSCPTYKREMVKVMSVETGRVYEVMFAEEFLVTE